MTVTVKNKGTSVAVSSVTKVDFRKHGSITKQTLSLALGNSVDLSFKIPVPCFEPDCKFDITVYADDNVIESKRETILQVELVEANKRCHTATLIRSSHAWIK